MRVGKNPAKLHNNNTIEQTAYHQIIVPVHLPYLTGYYKDGLVILKYCLESIYYTCHDKTYISIVNNGSCEKVIKYLNNLKAKCMVDEVIHTTAIGKYNAIAKALSGHKFELVTITDADVLFLPDWQKSVYQVFEAFPKSGVVGTTPNAKMLRYLTQNVHFDNLFNKKLKFRKVAQPEAMKRFAESIDNNDLFNTLNLAKILTLKQHQTISVVGTGHFCATYRPELLKTLLHTHDNSKISPKSDKILLDFPSIKHGHWRLSTYKNYTFHLGNFVEDWVDPLCIKIKKAHKPFSLPKPNITKYKSFPLIWLKNFQIQKIIYRPYVWKNYLVYRGLTKEEANKY